MAEFLTTNGTSHHIEQIVLKAKEQLVLVSPYLQLNQILMNRLTDASKLNKKITFIYGKDKLTQSHYTFLKSLSNIELFFCENLHAKCYHNNEHLVVSSMNLYEFSEKNNREMGVLIDKSKDAELFAEALQEIESIKNSSKLEFSNVSKAVVTQAKASNNEFGETVLKKNVPEGAKQHSSELNSRDAYLEALILLNKRIKERYPNLFTDVNNGIQALKYPHWFTSIAINGTQIDFCVEKQFESFQEQVYKDLVNRFPNERFFNNWYKIGCYPAKKRVFASEDEQFDFIVKLIDAGIEIINKRVTPESKSDNRPRG